MSSCDYGIVTRTRGPSLDDVVRRVGAALEEHGFGVLTTIDMAGTLQQKLGADMRPYVILGACNPQLALRAVGEDAQMGLLMPCNIVVQAAQRVGEFIVSAIDPTCLLEMIESPGPQVRAAIADADAALRGALGKL